MLDSLESIMSHTTKCVFLLFLTYLLNFKILLVAGTHTFMDSKVQIQPVPSISLK